MKNIQIALIFTIVLAPAAKAHVIADWDWHLVGGKAKRQLHWCVISSPPIPNPQDAFTEKEAKAWKGWAKEAFDNWVKDADGKATGWSFTEVTALDANCQIQIRINRRTGTSNLGKAVVPSGDEGDQRAKKVQIFINELDEKGKKRKFARKGKDTVDPVRLLKHEIGHCLRLDDTQDKKDIMSSGVETEVGNHDTTLSKEDYKEARDAVTAALNVKEKKVGSRPSKLRHRGARISVPENAFASESTLAVAIRRSVFFPSADSVAHLVNDERAVVLYAFSLLMDRPAERPLTCRLKAPRKALTGKRVFSGLHQLQGVPVRERIAAYRFDPETQQWLPVESEPGPGSRSVSFACVGPGVYGLGTILNPD